jgi:hypothetical protein
MYSSPLPYHRRRDPARRVLSADHVGSILSAPFCGASPKSTTRLRSKSRRSIAIERWTSCAA